MSGDAPAKAEQEDKRGLPVPNIDDALDPDTAAQLTRLPPQKQRDLHGLALWLNGYSYREAAALAHGQASDTDIHASTMRIWRLAKRMGMMERDRNNIAGRVATMAEDIAEEAGRQLSERLRTGTFSDAQLPVIYGIATDKLVKAAQIGQPKDTGGELHKVLEMLQEQGGGQVMLGYQPGHERPSERVIDVESEDG